MVEFTYKMKGGAPAAKQFYTPVSQRPRHLKGAY